MLVLRRRSHEVIVFEGGLTLTVVELVDHHAWIAFAGPGIDGSVTVAPIRVGDDGATIGVRGPSALSFADHVATVTRATDWASDDHRAVLMLETPVGNTIDFGGLSLEVTSVANGRATLGVDVACLPSRVAVAVHTVSGVEARIGIDAPPEIRVTREELWLEMLAANEAAPVSPASLGALRPRTGPPTP
jgi:sRNA-binding carbon storage regulator CsrA